MRTDKKNENVFAYHSRTDINISQKFQQIWIQQVKSIFPMEENPSKIGLHC
jgi:hypothetical protein